MRNPQESIVTTFLFTVIFAMVVSICMADKPNDNISEILVAGNSSKSVFRTARAIAPVEIPETSLKTRTPYRISMKKYPSGVLTYSGSVHPTGGYNYVQIDYNPDNSKNYMANGVWFSDAQWEFIPIKYCEHPGWYRLRNRGRPNQYLTWSAGESVYPNVASNYYVVLDSNSQGRISNHDFMVLPVRATDGSNHYRLIFKKLPKGAVTWSRKDNKTDAKFIMVDQNRETQYLDKYRKGAELYDDTLFSFQVSSIYDPETADFYFSDF